jgi:hypothetical protein
MEYESLYEIIPQETWNKFSYSRYGEHEVKVLSPYLESIGFTRIQWETGEKDSFGPLSRICHCIDKEGNFRHLVYG